MSEKLQGGLLAGSVDLSIPVILRSTTDNTEATGKAFGDVTASYWRQGGIQVDIPAVTLAAVNSAHADGGFKEVDSTNMPGNYRFDLPDAAIATEADWVVISIKVAGCYVFFQMFYLTVDINIVWDEAQSDHVVAGSFGKIISEINQSLNGAKVVVDRAASTFKVYDTDGETLMFTITKATVGNVDTLTRT